MGLFPGHLNSESVLEPWREQLSSLSKSFFGQVFAADFLNNECFPSAVNVGKSKLDISRTGNKKSSIFYNTHSYPTKVPVEDICKYVERHTKSGGVVLDPFCGSGMTALAAKLTGRNGYFSDLGTLAMHLTFNHVRACDPKKLAAECHQILSSVRKDANPYVFNLGKSVYEIKTVILSSVFACQNCKDEITFWDAAVDNDTHDVLDEKTCPSCNSIFSRTDQSPLHYVPVHYVYNALGEKSSQKRSANQNLLRATKFVPPRGWRLSVPNVQINSDREMYIRSALKLHGIGRLSDFYTPRNLFALDRLYKSIQSVSDLRIRAALMLAFTNTSWHGSRMRRFNNRGGHRPLTGTLYIPQLVSEGNVFEIFERKVKTLARFFSEIAKAPQSTWQSLTRTSAADLGHIPANSVDYVFTDPPFGSNIFYADCNFLAESWLGELTDTSQEAVVNKSLKPEAGGKTLQVYQSLLSRSFSEMSRVLKPNSVGHVVFNSTDGEVWSAVISAIEDAGLSLKKTHALDKIQKSVKGNRAAKGRENVATIDLVLEFKNEKREVRSSGARKLISESELPKLVSQLYPRFIKDNPKDDMDFVEANFFSYFIAHCHKKRIDTSSLDFSDVKTALRGAIKDRNSSKSDSRTAV
jgi:DNA modification methylase